MKAESHLRANAVLGVTAASALITLQSPDHWAYRWLTPATPELPAKIAGAVRAVAHWIEPWGIEAWGSWPGSAGMVALAVMLYFVGAVLPDIDNADSKIARGFVHLRLKHRGWTHSDVVTLALVAVPVTVAAL